MTESMLSNNCENISLKLKESAKHVTEKSMLMASSKLRGAADSLNVSVSVDGIWQLKGFTYLTEV